MSLHILDAHTHFFSYDFFRGLVEQLDPPADPGLVLPRLARQSGVQVPEPDVEAHTLRWLAEMDRYGIAHMVTFASLPGEAAAVRQAVEFAAGRLSGYCLVNPLAPNAAALVSRLATEGFRGLLFFPVMHRYSASDERALALYRLAAEHNLTCLVHFGLLSVKLRDLLGLPRPFDLRYGNPLDLQVAANSFREVRFVIPHFGCGFFRETLMLGSQCENVLVDTSSSNSWLLTQPDALNLADVFRRTRGVFGAERILFGTDSSTFPRGYRGDILAEQRLAMQEAGYSDAEQAAVLGGNAERLLGLAG